jgi:hypothetical protein
MRVFPAYCFVSENYRFRIQKVFVGSDPRFQLRVGMDGERDLEFIPVHCSAFALRMPLKEGHHTEDQARQEKDALLEWLRGQHATAE